MKKSAEFLMNFALSFFTAFGFMSLFMEMMYQENWLSPIDAIGSTIGFVVLALWIIFFIYFKKFIRIY